MGPEVHLRRTRQWALEEGFTEHEAEVIARADMGFDSRYPARGSAINITRHFSPGAWAWSAHYHTLAVRLNDLAMLGWALHCAQDAVAHGRAGEKHLLAMVGWVPHPDSWEQASGSVHSRIEVATRKQLRRFRERLR